MFAGLPEICYGTLPSNEKELIVIKRGESGYYKVDPLDDAYLCSADKNNELIGVTKGQRRAMEIGSLIGWTVPGSNPANYDEEGNYLKNSNSSVQ